MLCRTPDFYRAFSVHIYIHISVKSTKQLRNIQKNAVNKLCGQTGPVLNIVSVCVSKFWFKCRFKYKYLFKQNIKYKEKPLRKRTTHPPTNYLMLHLDLMYSAEYVQISYYSICMWPWLWKSLKIKSTPPPLNTTYMISC